MFQKFLNLAGLSKGGDEEVRPLTRREAAPPRISHRNAPSNPERARSSSTDSAPKRSSFEADMGADATPEQAALIESYSGEIWTILENSTKEGDIALRQHFVFLSNGWLLLDRDEISNSRLIALQQKMRQQKMNITAVIRVSLSDIRMVRQNFARNHGGLKKAADITSLRGIPIQRFQKELLTIFERAEQNGISDIHFFVLANITYVKMRINGGLETVFEKTHDWGVSISAAVYEMCGSKGGGQYNPESFPSGQVSSSDITLPGNLQAMRMQQAPLPLNGRYVVLRLLTEGGRGRNATLDTLGYRKCHLRDINSVRRKSEGVIFIAGPTGSGKSTTLIITLRADMKENPLLNVVTLEDPIEFILEGAAQLSIGDAKDEKDKLALIGRAMNAILRLDPDIAMFGEVRNVASAKTVFQLSNTGHRVYSTVHASNAVAIIGRLREIGVELYNLTDPAQLSGLIAQRLIRRLCPHCAIPLNRATDEQLAREGMDADLVKSALALEDVGKTYKDKHKHNLGGIRITNHDGCPKCNRGISGRSVVAETIRPDERFFEKIRKEETSEAIEYWLQERNGLRMSEHAAQLMVCGDVSPRDVITATGDYSLFDIKARGEAVFGDLML